MSDMNYVSVDRVFSKINRDLKGTEINETDTIEWIGEALEFLQVPQVLVEEVKFIPVEDYHSILPEGLHMITQIARNNHITKRTLPEPIDVVEKEEGFLNLDWTYEVWTNSPMYQQNYTPVRLSTHSFFNSIVCKEKDQSLYNTCEDEYTIVGMVDKKLRYSFREGEVAISYLKNTVDEETGYPLIPDHISYITAITYYLKWKIAEMHEWSGREGWASKAEKAEERWLKYVRQAKNIMKMPRTLDQFQNLLNQTHNLIPNHQKYYGYFGKLGREDVRVHQQFNKRR